MLTVQKQSVMLLSVVNCYLLSNNLLLIINTLISSTCSFPLLHFVHLLTSAHKSEVTLTEHN